MRQGKNKIRDLEIFDKASRGFWGSLLLLWEQRVREVIPSLRTSLLLRCLRHFTAVGAVLVISAFAFNTATQQTVSTVFYLSNEVIKGIARSDYYDSWVAVYGLNTDKANLLSLWLHIVRKSNSGNASCDQHGLSAGPIN